MHRQVLLRRPDYADAVMSTGPVFYVPMQGGVVVEIVRGVKATVSATAPLIVAGPFQGANGYRFSASTADHDSFTIPTNAAYHPGNTFSVGGWVNQLANGGSFPSFLNAGANDFNPGPSQAGKFGLGKNGVGTIFVTTATYKATGWHHLLLTKAGATTTCYVDGYSVAGTTTDLTVVAGSSNIELGAAGTSGDLDGSLAHMAIWNRVLTAGEALALYLAAVQ